jgi:hypothetical protein
VKFTRAINLAPVVIAAETVTAAIILLSFIRIRRATKHKDDGILVSNSRVLSRLLSVAERLEARLDRARE